MSENTLQWISFLKLIYVAIFSLFYGLGGMSGKWKRRFLGSGILIIGIIGFSLWLHIFSWFYLLSLPLLSLSLSLGYGAEDTKLKYIKRTYCGLAYALSTTPIFVVTGKYELFALHIILCLLSSIWLGVRGILGSARAEETTIGFVIGFLPIMAL